MKNLSQTTIEKYQMKLDIFKANRSSTIVLINNSSNNNIFKIKFSSKTFLSFKNILLYPAHQISLANKPSNPTVPVNNPATADAEKKTPISNILIYSISTVISNRNTQAIAFHLFKEIYQILIIILLT